MASSSSCLCVPCNQLFTSLKAFLFQLSFRPDYTVNRYLLSLAETKVPPSPTSPIRGVTSTDVTISGDLWIRVYTPLSSSSSSSLPLIFFFHGGGFTFGSPDYQPIDSFSLDFARELGAIVVSLNYRLAPEHRFPSPYTDAFHILNLFDNGIFFSDSQIITNADLSRCFIAGESAGGNIAHHLALRASKHQFNRLTIAGLIAIQPFFGGEDRTKSELQFGDGSWLSLEWSDWYWKAFLPVGSNRDHPASNVVKSKAVDMAGLDFPATVVFIGGKDPLRDRNREYGEWLKKSGKEVAVVEYPNPTHGFTWDSDSPEYWMLMRDAREFIDKQNHAYSKKDPAIKE